MEKELEKEFEKQIGIGKAKVGLVVCAVLVVILAISNVFTYVNQQNRINALETDNASLQGQMNTLETQKSDLGTQVSALEAEKSDLESQVNNLETQVDSLTSEKNSLQNQVDLLTTENTNLQSQVDSLTTQNENLQAEYDHYVTAYQRLQDEINHRFGLQNLETFITPEDSDVNAFVFSITGGWSNPDDWDEYWDDLKAMYDWVVNNIEYRYDGLYPLLPYDPSGTVDYWDEMWQFPNETLDLKQGDCEDIAILLCSMIRCHNDMTHWAECILITNEFGHLAVQILVREDKLVIFDPAGLYYSSDSSGNIVFNDISIEINNWLDYWKPEMGSDVYVDSVFSDYIHKTFTSTDDYITWMYSR